MQLFHTGLVALTVAPLALARTFTVTNNCSYTVWPAIFTDPNVGTAVPDHPTGWEAPPRSSVSFMVPDNWASGRIWGRRDCDFDANGNGTCVDGGCNGGLVCDPHNGIGATPASLAEWTLGTNGNPDYYDVSIVDGFNLPIRIDNDKGCHVADCPVDLIPDCPSPLQGPFDSAGNAAGCKTACAAGIDHNQADSANCCTGSHSTPDTCPASGVQYYNYFKDNCPNSYVYAYDEGSGTALWTCDSGLQADYTLTFCP
ncbi:thaumatin-like protein [Gloeophyllum trabeum ATCC 11539]|uniref:Thaumatin-like protein n=1 Tax=Gloeophyllum trabeum (strain ATCC 11539 / FP-39264 / Madison 617) TaxID=670483 RepID=S7RBW7_GLOTA|nr:thaumatin-like protein [Gloeophyllum trabeum ATCC 11539]EPQ51745.1 thaumatin-like protein [Gloeophyllum trabeum ATCC 11539]